MARLKQIIKVVFYVISLALPLRSLFSSLGIYSDLLFARALAPAWLFRLFRTNEQLNESIVLCDFSPFDCLI